MLKINEIKNKPAWDSFIYSQDNHITPFFQLWNYGEVSKRIGFEIIRLGIYEEKKLIGVALVICVKAKRGTYLHLRHGPVFVRYDQLYIDFLIKHLRKIAREKRASFIRLSPLVREETLGTRIFKNRKFIASPIHRMDAEICWVLDVSPSEEELLKDMRKSHRYLIRKARSMNIKITQTKKVSDMKKFTNLYINLSQRKHFVPHKGVREEFELFGKENEEILFLAEYEGKVISAALISFLNKNAIYRHGASDPEYKHIPASYLIQWNAILEAKKRGIKLYNFWGISDTHSKKHPWYGTTMFKLGFGGRKEEFIHAHDLPLNSWYYKTYLIEWLTKILKGYF